MNELKAQPGPQTLFQRSGADIAIYGGEAGSGKSYISLMEAARWTDKAKYRAGVFRRHSSDLTKGGGLWDEALGMYPGLGARLRGGNELDATWPSGAQVGFYGLKEEGDKYLFQGTQFDLLLFDELTHFTESQFWYLQSRLRSRCGMRPYCRATVNPDPASWVKQLILPWLDPDTGIPRDDMSGRLLWIARDGDKLLHFPTREAALAATRAPKSLTFIRARLADNKLGDPGYRDQLELMDRATRSALLEGNWNEVSGPGTYFDRTWFEMADAPPARLRLCVRGWDRAGSAPTPANPNPDWTATVKMGEDEAGNLWWLDADRQRVEPGAVDEWQIAQARIDGGRVVQARWQDPAQAGKAEAHATTKAQRAAAPNVQIEVVSASKNKEAYAKILSARCDRHVQERTGKRVYMVRGPWNDWLLSELQRFPSRETKDDGVDAASRAYLHIHDKRSGFAQSFLAGLSR